MALKDLMRSNERTEGTSREGSAPSFRVHRTASPSTCIDAHTEVNGKLRCKDTVRIEGRVKGEVRCEQNVIVTGSANVQASIQAESVVIAGQVKGDIDARRKITLESSARVHGNLNTPGIVIEEGAKLEGRITIGSDEADAPKASTGRSTSTRSSNGARQPAAGTPSAPSA